jgi:hypothetical protein
MTKLWGPLGWMTLHSISAIYPENPTPADKSILLEFMTSFRDCITCQYCRGHFSRMFSSYTKSHPEWNASRFDFFVFICRAHNTVNKRLDKPIFPTIESCIERLQYNTKYRRSAEYRRSYIKYLISDWNKLGGGDGMIGVHHAKKLQKINEEYFNPRDTGFDTLKFERTADVTEFIPEDFSEAPRLVGLPNPGQLQNMRLQFSWSNLRMPTVIRK